MMKETTNTKTVRYPYIDAAKGILIICVVLGHVLNFESFLTGAVKTMIYSFHMPAFFVISGILIKPEARRFPEFAKRRAKRLLIPYVLFELMGGFLQMLLLGTEEVNLTGILYGILTLHCHTGADWFLPTLFAAELLCFISIQYAGQKPTALLALLGFVLAFAIPDWNYPVAVVRRILVAYGFITAGFLFKRFFTAKSGPVLLVDIIGIVLISCCNGVVDLSVRSFHNPVLYVLGGIAGTCFVLNFSQYLPGKLEQVFAYIGQNSLTIMGTHQHVLTAANVIYGSVYPISMQLLLLSLIAVYELVIIKLSRRTAGKEHG